MTSDGFFILGNPRSGTSLLRNLLNAHPGIIVPPECGFLLWLRPRFMNAVWDKDTRLRFIAAVMGSRKFETWEIGRERLHATIIDADIPDYATAAALVYEAYARARGREAVLWGDKNNYYVKHVPELIEAMPRARFIHIVRDVRDVVCSYREISSATIRSQYAPDLTVDAEEAAQEWSLNNAMIGLAGAADPSRYLLVRYEDLVQAFGSTMGRVFDFLGVVVPDGFSIRSHLDGLDEPAEFLQWKRKVALPVDATSVGRYSRDLDAATLARVERAAAIGMKRYGYGAAAGG